MLLLAASTAGAQDFRGLAPRQLPAAGPAAVPAMAGDGSGDGAGNGATPPSEALLLNALKGLVFVAAASDIDPAGVAALTTPVDVSRVPLLAASPAFLAAVRNRIGKPLRLADLDQIARLATDSYRAAGRPLVAVVPPPQDVSNGIVQFVVSEYRVGQVIIEGNRHVATDRLRRMIRLRPGDSVDQDRLLADLDWLAANPFRKAEIIYRRAPAPLTTDIVVRVTDRVPLRVFAGLDNYGLPLTRRQRLSAGFNWGDAFGTDGQLSYQLTGSPDLLEGRAGRPPGLLSQSFTWVQPLAGRQTLQIFGTWQQVHPALGPELGQDGRSLQISGRLNLPVPAGRQGRAALSLGYDFKQTNNNLLFGGASISAQTTRIHQAVLALSGGWRTPAGITGVDLTAVFSPGGLGPGNSDAAFQPSPTQFGTPFAQASYAYLRLGLSQTTPLGHSGLEARTRLSAQIASGNLLPTEQLSAAGPGSVRGYDANAVLGSQGVVATQEFWLPPLPAVRIGTHGLTSQMQLGVFVEAGQVGQPVRLADEPRWTRTAATGVTANWSIGPVLQVRADLGWQLVALPGLQPGTMGHVSLTVGL
jgi:hemolysin activation/secretion protein